MDPITRYAANIRESRGFGFITFAHKADADSFIDKYDGFQLEGRPLTVQIAK